MEERHSVREVQSVMGGQYSLPFAIAVALTRDMSNPLVFNDEALRDPVVRDLAKRMELIPHEVSNEAAMGATKSPELILEIDSQSHTLSTRPYKGSPQNPFSWEDATEKFGRYAGQVIGVKQVSAIIEAVGHLDQASDMADVAQLVAAG
jgi:2-methylcitrate dehydratase PrpD